jgi:hypothetical protein
MKCAMSILKKTVVYRYYAPYLTLFVFITCSGMCKVSTCIKAPGRADHEEQPRGQHNEMYNVNFEKDGTGSVLCALSDIVFMTWSGIVR